MPTETTHSVTTSGPAAESPDGRSSFATSDVIATPSDEAIYPGGVAHPPGSTDGTVNAKETPAEARGIGTEGEVVAWEGRYSLKNFLGRLIGAVALAVGWLALAAYTWPGGHEQWRIVTIVLGAVLAIYALTLLRRVLMARYGHRYQLTNRRLFVSTGVFNRRRDQVELLRVQDIYSRQNFYQRWLSVGTVAVVSSEPQLPMLYLVGVEDPKGVMDLIWHHARAERDRRSVKIDQL